MDRTSDSRWHVSTGAENNIWT